MNKFKNFIFRNSVIIVILVLIVIFSFTSPYFLTFHNLINLLNQNSYFIIAAVGLGILMISGGIDLSVANQMALMGVIIAILITSAAVPWIGAFIATRSPKFRCIKLLDFNSGTGRRRPSIVDT